MDYGNSKINLQILINDNKYPNLVIQWQSPEIHSICLLCIVQ